MLRQKEVSLTVKDVWQAISTGLYEFNDLLATLSGADYDWARGYGTYFAHEYGYLMRLVDNYYLGLLDFIEDEEITTRKEMAEWVKFNVPLKYISLVFRLLDNKDIQTKIWNMIEPIGGTK